MRNFSLIDAWQVYARLEQFLLLCNAERQDMLIREEEGEESAVSLVELLLTALFAGGHVLFETYAGSGLSLLSKTLGESLEDAWSEDGIVEMKAYRRIQCTPDLLPSDLTGYMMLENGTMSFRRGPIFSSILLVDEINRTSPKVQSALLEPMVEHQVTVDDRCYRLAPLFLVIATQNPLERQGTFELPYALRDRFLIYA